ncbi:hypothetical protein HDV06_001974, partial [Boothiomyces sp. JEL0866]
MLLVLSVLFLFIGEGLAVYFAISYNSLQECIGFRKFIYSCVYLGFFIFDIYQMMKIKTITAVRNPSEIYFAGLLSVRFASYVVNIYYITSAQVAVSDGLGACKTVFTDDWLVYQEHLISVAFEFGLIIKLAWFIYKTKVPGIPLHDFIAKIVDHEVVSFGIYLMVEILYLLCFQFVIVKQWISILNALYFIVPTALYLSNMWYILKSKN